MYIDDAMAAGADDLLYDREGQACCDATGRQLRRAEMHFLAARAELERLGWQSEPSKEVPPGVCMEALGVEVDLLTARMRLGSRKRERYAAQAREVAGLRDVDRGVFEQLLGRLQFASQCFPLGRQFTHALWRVARAQFRLQARRVRLSRAAVAELWWWVHELEADGHEGVPLAARVMESPGAVYADASERAFSAWAVGSDGVVRVVAGEWTEAERRLTIAELELLASTFGLVSLAPWLPRDVLSFSDNTVAVAAMSRGSPRSPVMQAVARRRTMWLCEAGVVELPRRVTTVANLWADIGSRPELGGWAEVARQAAALGCEVERVHIPAGWRDTEGLMAAEPTWGS